MIKKNKIPTIIGILLLIGGVFAGVMLLKGAQIFKIGANPSEAPKDVRISNLSDTSATISWVTADETTAFISYGISSNLGSVVKESQDDQKYFTHSINLTGLSPSTNYYFKIISNGTTFDNNSIPWQFSTGGSIAMGSNSMSVSGSIITASGTPSKRAIVVVTIGGYVISTLTSDKGTFVLQLSSVRTPDLTSYAEIDPANTLLEVYVMSENGETSTVKIFPQSANPIPAIIIGQSQDYRNLEPNMDAQNPNADLKIPENVSPISKLDTSGEKMDNESSVTLGSIEDGEVITNVNPEFFGEGPAGENITITVNSENEISGETTVSSKGTWKWSPLESLSEGAHSITISWTDKSGVLRTLTRNFVVQAGELPSYEASPSATPTNTPKTSSTPSPVPSPISTKTPLPAATILPTVKPDELPETGSLTPTIILSIMGLGVFVFGFFIWKVSESKA